MHVIVCYLHAEVNVQDLLIVLGENFAKQHCNVDTLDIASVRRIIAETDL